MNIRLATPSDASFVTDSWLHSFRSSPYVGPIPANRYYEWYRIAINDLCSRKNVRILVAFDPDADQENEAILGWIAYEKGTEHRGKSAPVIHWAYTRHLYQKTGVLRALLKHADIDLSSRFYYTFNSPLARRLNAKWPAGQWNQKMAQQLPKDERQQKNGQDL